MTETEYFEQLFPSRAAVRVWQFLLDHPKQSTTLGLIADRVGLAQSTVFRVMNELIRMGFVTRVKVGKRYCIYNLILDNRTKVLIDFYRKMSPFLRRMRVRGS